ncbi:MAG: PD40 domain-containing protein [Verrucomicrobiales bacterium]|nr:PD40 domain-containing protein [Verrucomicrobiales bacterium]
MNARLSLLLLLVVCPSVLPGLQAAGGVLYYNQIASPVSPVVLRRVNGDGTGDQAILLNLPAALYPTVSRDGRRLLVTSPDPGRPFKISLNVYAIDLLTGFFGRATTFLDEVNQNGVLFNPDLATLFGDTTISSYKVNFPYYKAFSPEGARVVVMDFLKAGSVVNEVDVQASSGRFPIVDVYNLADALPAGPFIYRSPQERNGLNQGGDGVDWHPTLNEVVVPVDSDIPATGNAAGNGLGGTVLAVYSTTSISPFIRRLTNPVGQRDSLFDLSNLILTATTPHDYAPSISPDGTRVAYVRHFMRQDSRFDGAAIAPLPAICSIRVINYDGNGDREVLRLAEGLWVSKVAWSPDGTRIAFDLAPQQVVNGWNSTSGDAARSTLNVVNADGSNPHQLVAGAASYPSWGAGLPARPVLQFHRDGTRFELRIDQLTPGTPFVVEGSTNARDWQSLGTFIAAGTTHLITITPNANAPFAFYRVRL